MSDDISDKVRHVRTARQTRDHTCHWPGCQRQVKPAFWGCPGHWRRVRAAMKLAIWRTYQVGQEQGDAPVTREYLDAADAVQAWCRTQPL